MNYGEIKKIDIANGEGVRVSLFVSGCRVNCPGCFNKATWDFCYGKEFTKETEDELIAALSLDFISGLTVLGGEPFEPENQAVLSKFLSRVKKELPDKTIWCYTGYVYDKDILPEDGRKHTEYTQEMLDNINVLVDGPFIQELKDVSLKFRGSRNQRILKLN
ncbi:MAG: anaerobic ribonucleoside-triphosphate reductase activating protein [Treponema sp.]|nr:anaerobic ribonucleoside-triphosphate reductase activating protein [Treponema sp.]